MDECFWNGTTKRRISSQFVIFFRRFFFILRPQNNIFSILAAWKLQKNHCRFDNVKRKWKDMFDTWTDPKITTYKKPPHRTEKNYTILSLARAPARSFFYTTEYISFVSSYSSRSNIPPKMWAQWSIIFLFILKFHSRLPFRTSVFLFLFFFLFYSFKRTDGLSSSFQFDSVVVCFVRKARKNVFRNFPISSISKTHIHIVNEKHINISNVQIDND